jgi:hypothetical protein
MRKLLIGLLILVIFGIILLPKVEAALATKRAEVQNNSETLLSPEDEATTHLSASVVSNEPSASDTRHANTKPAAPIAHNTPPAASINIHIPSILYLCLFLGSGLAFIYILSLMAMNKTL